AFIIELQISLCKRGCAAHKKIGEAISGSRAVKGEIAVPIERSEYVLKSVNPVYAHRNLMISPDQAEVVRELKTMRGIEAVIREHTRTVKSASCYCCNKVARYQVRHVDTQRGAVKRRRLYLGNGRPVERSPE